jgi:hypothetical protein
LGFVKNNAKTIVRMVKRTAIVNGEGINFLKKISIAFVIFIIDILKAKI